VKNKQKLEVHDLKPVFYYLQNGTPNNSITSCLLLRGKEIAARGVAICSPADCFNKKRGRNIALGRAMKAYEKMILSDRMMAREFSYGTNEALCDAAFEFKYKSEYRPTYFSPLERNILSRIV